MLSNAQLARNAYRIHRRLVEFLGKNFFPHLKTDGVWFDNQNWRGRVIATRESLPRGECLTDSLMKSCTTGVSQGTLYDTGVFHQTRVDSAFHLAPCRA